MSYKFITDSIEVRGLKEGRVPRYIVNGKGLVAGIKDTYDYFKRPDGTYRTFHSMFTSNCLDSIKKQAVHKRLFIDAQHETALNINIRSMLKDKLSKDEISKIDKMLKIKELPLAKLNDIEIKNDSLMLYTELNPAFRELDKEHKSYFDATWYSLENKFLNGISINFANAKIINDENNEMVIDDIDVLGFSYVDAPASPENTITEVAIRAMKEGEKMAEEKKEDETKVQLETGELKKQMESLQDELKTIKEEKEKTENENKEKETKEKEAEIIKQKEEQKQMIDDLQKKADELKKNKEEGEKNSAKGEVNQTDKYGKQLESQTKDKTFYVENLKKITEGHDATMKTINSGKIPSLDKKMEGFSELVNLQAKSNDPTLGMPEEDAKLAQDLGLLKKGTADIIVPKKIE